MGLISTLFSRGRLTPAASDDFWYSKVAQGTTSGVKVDEDTALNYSAVWAATRLIAETIASLPRRFYQHLPDGKAPAPDYYLSHLLETRPNPEMDSFAFWEGRLHHAVNWGNGFAEIERTVGGKALNLWPIHPSRVKRPERLKSGQRVYPVKNTTGPDTLIPAENMFHLVGVLSEDGLWGKGAISQGRESIGMGLATERYGAAFFGNGARPGGVIEHPNRLNDQAKKNLRESWNRIHQGPGNAHGTAVLEEGSKYHALDIPPEDAQFLGTRQHNITEIARWYRIAPHLLGELSRATNNNIEAENLGFVVHSIRPWLVRIESAVARQLMTPVEARRYYLEFLLDALLRGDLKTRTEALAQQFLNGAINLDEWRAVENRNPLPLGSGKKHYLQMQMVPIADDAAGPGDEGSPSPSLADEAEPGELLAVPDVRQTEPWSCGAAATAGVCQYFGVEPSTEEAAIAELGSNPQDGTKVWAIVAALARAGLAATTGNGMTVEDLAEFFEAGRPVICPVQSLKGAPANPDNPNGNGHYVTVTGVGFGKVFFQDPVDGLDMMDAEDFLAAWHDADTDGQEYTQFGIAVGDSILPEDEEAFEPGEQAPGAGSTPDSDESGLAAGRIAAANAVLADSLRRMLRLEGNEAERAARHPDGFLARIDAFYERRFPGTFGRALAPPVAAILEATGDKRDLAEAVESLAAVHSACSREDLLTASEAQPGDLAARVRETVAGWLATRTVIGDLP